MIILRDVVMRLTAGGRPITILDDITIEIPSREFVVILGPSGSGKSTLLGLIAGLDTPTSGVVSIDGVDLGGLDEAALAALRLDKIGFVFQSFQLVPTLTARENVAVPMELAGDVDPLGRARDLLVELGLGDRADHYPVQLSGGEQQRVALARACARRPPIVLADEPTGNLDAESGTQVMELLLRLHRDHGNTLVLVTHDPAWAARADRAIMLRGGRVPCASDGSRRDLS